MLFNKKHKIKNIPVGFCQNPTLFTKKYSDCNKTDLIISENVHLGNEKTSTTFNLNTLIDGVAGSGKTRRIVLPNLLQANNSYFIFDPHGELYEKASLFLSQNGYVIKTLNFKNLEKSNHYNPLMYINCIRDIEEVVDCMMNGLSVGKGNITLKSLFALLFYQVIYIDNTKDMGHFIHLSTNEKQIVDIVKSMHTIDNDFVKSNLEQLEHCDLTSTAHEAVQTIGLLELNKWAEWYSDDDMDFEDFNSKKMACFIVPTQGLYKNCLALMACKHFYNAVSATAHNDNASVKITCVLEEMSALGAIPGFADMLARSQDIGINYIYCLHSVDQLITMYHNEYKQILDNSHIHIHLMALSMRQIDFVHQEIGELIPKIQLRNRGCDECFICIKNQEPIMDFVYPTEKHRNYKLF